MQTPYLHSEWLPLETCTGGLVLSSMLYILHVQIATCTVMVVYVEPSRHGVRVAAKYDQDRGSCSMTKPILPTATISWTKYFWGGGATAP